MRKGGDFFINIISFFGGCIITYFALQYSYFKINTELNIIETLLSILTALIGLYIAVSIQKKNNRSQSLHAFLQSKTDSIWSNFSGFDSQVNNQSTIKLSIVTKSTKSFYQDLKNVKTVFQSFNLNCACIDQLESSFGDLDNLLTNTLPISNNIIQLSVNRAELIKRSHQVHQNIVATFVEINSIL